jgi:hypothetical protein
MTTLDSRRDFVTRTASGLLLALVTAWPSLIASRGPHGITLLRHAQAGGERAAAVADFLVSRGAQ